jgi:hypothetical protein
VTELAPVEYIREYYEGSLSKAAAYKWNSIHVSAYRKGED